MLYKIVDNQVVAKDNIDMQKDLEKFLAYPNTSEETKEIFKEIYKEYLGYNRD